PQLYHREPAISGGQRHDVVDQAEGIQRRLLPGGQKRNAAELVRVPQRNFALSEAVADKAFPLVIFQDQIRYQRIVRNRWRFDDFAVGGEWFVLVQVFGGQQRAPAQCLRPEHRQRQGKQQGNDG